MAATRYSTDLQKSIYGRRLESLTAASTMEGFGLTVLSGSTATFTLQAPERLGQIKEIINASSISTAAMAIVRSTAAGACNFLPATSGTTEGATEGNVKRLNLINVGSRVTLRAISTAQWAPLAFGSSLYFSMSTSS
jgi:hypothetical protein